jgi:DNA polymerase III delta prime subunit
MLVRGWSSSLFSKDDCRLASSLAFFAAASLAAFASLDFLITDESVKLVASSIHLSITDESIKAALIHLAITDEMDETMHESNTNSFIQR